MCGVWFLVDTDETRVNAEGSPEVVVALAPEVTA